MKKKNRNRSIYRGLSAEGRRRVRPPLVFSAAVAALCLLFARTPAQAQEQREAIELGLTASRFEVFFGFPALAPMPLPREGKPRDIAYLQTGAFVPASKGQVESAGAGMPLFLQGERLLAGGEPRTAENFIALAHKGGFVSLYSAQNFQLNAEIAAQASPAFVEKGFSLGGLAAEETYLFRVYDSASGLWVNPAFFLQGMEDRAAPKVEEIVLLGQNASYVADTRKNIVQNLAQGSYVLALRAVDPLYAGGSVSGIFRIKAVLNGTIVMDKKLDSALAAESGLAFLGMGAPSASLIGADGRILLGERFIPRGTHTLELWVYDYAGNAGNSVWKFSAR